MPWTTVSVSVQNRFAVLWYISNTVLLVDLLVLGLLCAHAVDEGEGEGKKAANNARGEVWYIE